MLLDSIPADLVPMGTQGTAASEWVGVHGVCVKVVLRYFHRCRYWSSTAVVLLLEGVLVSWLLAMREYGGHEYLRGSGRRSVIPYVHG
jgi:hypothetical protein